MEFEKQILYIGIFCVWIANINDLIRGNWFYNSTTQIVVMNVWGVLALISILWKNRGVKGKQPVGERK